MDRSVAPNGLAIALRAAGLRLAGPLGAGSAGPRWSATDEAGARWALTVVPAPGAERARRRAEVLAGLEDPHLTRLGPVVALPDGGVVLAHEAVPGVDLATLAAARGALRPGEVVGLLVPVARALAALHGTGLSHGDVSPANVVVGDGRVVLVDLVHGADAAEHGTTGFAAPERLERAGPAGDVHALARVGLVLLGPDASSDPAGAPVRAEGALRAVLERAADERPRRRGDAQGLAAALGAACPAEAVDLPDPAVLARLALRRLAGSGRDGVRPGRTGAGSGHGATTRRRAARGRHRRRGLGRWWGRATVAIAGVVVVGAVVAGVLGPTRNAPTPSGVLAAAAHLTSARTQALARLDRPALGAVTMPGSRAARADRELLAALVRAGRGPSVEQLAVLVRPGVGPDRVVTGSWLRTSDGPRLSQVELVLGRTPAGWRVAEVRPAAP